MYRIIYSLIIFIGIGISLQAQDAGMYFGPKGGLNFAQQNWDGYERNILIANHIAIFTESLDQTFTGSLYAQLGYHIRGSSIRAFTFSGNNFTRGFRFHNLALQTGLKKRFDRPGNFIPYYMVGVRLEYNLSTNLDEFNNSQNFFYPFDVYVNKLLYGISFGGGFEREVSEFVIPFFEISFHPDLSLQYRSPPLTGGFNPWTGQAISVGERKIRNISMELTIGVKFMRKVTYID